MMYDELLDDDACLARLQKNSRLTDKERIRLLKRDLPRLLDIPTQHPFEYDPKHPSIHP